ncbi:DUF2971 domain-containing protein [uncultured Pontibacter sp.]|uniref:DUF2971 domain-containing protein n=1 Tax=uncultured Pontibacter sp. TaxID=453356 RepID=UPI0026291847|nr:DUF2971 domain-containing protein [uncultured Pontibacter sp.]
MNPTELYQQRLRAYAAAHYLSIDNACLMEADPVIYHYTSLKSALSILGNSELRYNQPASLLKNDPDELDLSIIRYRQNKQKFLNAYMAQPNADAKTVIKLMRVKGFDEKFFDSIFREGLNALRSRFGVACFSIRSDNAHLWENYAEKGAGVCIGFRSNTINRFCLQSRVKYSKMPKCVDWDDEEKEALVVWALQKRLRFTKEEEIRSLCLDVAKHCIYKNEMYLASFSKDAVAEVYLGSSRSDEEEQSLASLIESNEYKVKLKRFDILDAR